MHMTIAGIPALAGFLLGGAVWGIQMGQLSGAIDTRRLAWAGLLGFGPITLIVAVGLSMAEPPLVANFGPSTGVHRIFTLLFVPSAFLIAGVSAWAIGRGLQDNALAASLFGRVGLSAGLTFLVINLIMEAFGWVVGAPGAAERADDAGCEQSWGGAGRGWGDGLFAGEGRNFGNRSRGCGFHEVKSSLKIIPGDIRIETIQSMKRNRHESI